MQGNWNYPPPIRFGAGRVKEAGDACLELGMRKPLIVTDADLAEPAGVFNFFDLAAYLALFNANDPAADLAAPFGVLNFFDVAGFIAAYNAGCP